MSLAPDLLKSEILTAEIWKNETLRALCRRFSPTLIAASLAGSIVLIALSQGVTDGRLYGAATVIGIGLCLILESARLLRRGWRPALARVALPRAGAARTPEALRQI